MGTISAPTQKTQITRRARRSSITVYRPPVTRGESGMMHGGSVIESQHAPKSMGSSTSGVSYADIMATSPPAETLTVDIVVASSPSCEQGLSPAPTEESAISPETVLPEHLESLHLSSSAKPVVTLPAPVTITPASFPQVPSQISTFELPSPVSTRESSCVDGKPESDKTPNPESVLFTTSKKFETKKRYGGFTFAKGDPEKLERLNHKGSKLESRWAC